MSAVELFAGLVPDPEPDVPSTPRPTYTVDPPDRPRPRLRPGLEARAREMQRQAEQEHRNEAREQGREEHRLTVMDAVVRKHGADARRVEEAVLADGRAHGGVVDPNRVRLALADEDGRLTVNPRALSASYAGLRARGVIRYRGPQHDVPNRDTRGRNTDKRSKTYRLVHYLGRSA